MKAEAGKNISPPPPAHRGLRPRFQLVELTGRRGGRRKGRRGFLVCSGWLRELFSRRAAETQRGGRQSKALESQQLWFRPDGQPELCRRIRLNCRWEAGLGGNFKRFILNLDIVICLLFGACDLGFIPLKGNS
jgi:hypothetical protein